MEVLKINFSGFWPHFDVQQNIFVDLLRKNYCVEISDNPSLLFCINDNLSKGDYLRYNCHKVLIGLENQRANWFAYDYALDFDYEPQSNKHFRFPLWALWNTQRLLLKESVDSIMASKSKFCCMVVSNPYARERIDFFQKLSNYKVVDSGGKYLNNIGGPVEDKMDFIKQYKFVISFENSSYPGYTTEKLIEPMLVGSIPIYWGDPMVGKDFNTQSFLNVGDFANWDDVVEQIILLDQNPLLYREMLAQPWFNDNKMPTHYTHEALAKTLNFIVEDSKTTTPVSQSYKRYIHVFELKMLKCKHILHRIFR